MTDEQLKTEHTCQWGVLSIMRIVVVLVQVPWMSRSWRAQLRTLLLRRKLQFPTMTLCPTAGQFCCTVYVVSYVYIVHVKWTALHARLWVMLQTRLSWDTAGRRDSVWGHSFLLLQNAARSLRCSTVCWFGRRHKTCYARWTSLCVAVCWVCSSVCIVFCHHSSTRCSSCLNEQLMSWVLLLNSVGSATHYSRSTDFISTVAQFHLSLR